MRQYRTGSIEDIMENLRLDRGDIESQPTRAVPLAEPSAVEIYRQSKKMLEQIANDPNALLGVINANYQRLKEGDIDSVFPDKRATAWLRAMHMLTEVAARMYEQNPYEFSQLQSIAGGLQKIENYVRSNRHCPPELKTVPVEQQKLH